VVGPLGKSSMPGAGLTNPGLEYLIHQYHTI
jgi:hypothetical protein